MTTLTQAQQAFVNQYLAMLTDADKQRIPNLHNVSAYYFCSDEYNANECARLVDIGKKTATCSLKQGWIVDNEPFPTIGALDIIINWAGEPICIVKTMDVDFAQFKDVPEAFAIAEGEGDGTYAWWRHAHLEFFTQFAQDNNLKFNESSMLVLERFKKVYP